MKRFVNLLLLTAIAVCASLPLNAQFAKVQQGPVTQNISGPSLAVDTNTPQVYFCNGPCTAQDVMLGVYEGVTSTSLTTGNFTSLTGPNIKIPKNSASVLFKHVRIHVRGIYTTAAASVLNLQLNICQTSNACGGTAVPLCTIASTNQANILANGQFDFTCELTTDTVGASGKFMPKGDLEIQLGAATSAALSEFADTTTAVSAAIDLTQDEFVVPQFKFTTSNAGNTATVQQMTVELVN